MKRNRPILTKTEVDRASITITVKAGRFSTASMKVKVKNMELKDFNKILSVTKKYSKK